MFPENEYLREYQNETLRAFSCDLTRSFLPDGRQTLHVLINTCYNAFWYTDTCTLFTRNLAY